MNDKTGNKLSPETVIENITQLVEWMAGGCKPQEAWRIGTEHEKFGFCRKQLTPLPYEGEHGIRAMLEGLKRFGWQGIYEYENGEKLIALTRAKEKGGGSITLEPGGQLELSGAALATIHQTCAEVNRHLEEVRTIADELGQAYLGLGFSPLWGLEAAPQMPKTRYAIMHDYMPSCGRYGWDMMYLSCTVQVNLDFSSEADMAEKLRIGLALQPLATALFANSPFKHGKPTGNLSQRSLNWLDTDSQRTGMLPFVFDEGFGFAEYVDYALNVPMYFVIRDGHYIAALGQSFRDFLKGELPALPGEKPTIRDWQNHLTTLFPEARVKRFIEMRGADSGPWRTLCALPSFWVGLLYDSNTQKQISAMIEDWTQAERDYLRCTAPVKGLATPFRGGTLLDIARPVLALAEQGLTARGKKNEVGMDESHYLQPLREIVENGRSPAEILLDKYHNEWGGDIRPIFEEMAFWSLQ